MIELAVEVVGDTSTLFLRHDVPVLDERLGRRSRSERQDEQRGDGDLLHLVISAQLRAQKELSVASTILGI
ncbi:MAG: hypothetical protein ACM3KM_04450 [Acidobacteriaceae bacterium]